MEELGAENMSALTAAFEEAGSAEAFLCDEDFMLAPQATTLSEAGKVLRTSFDFDGLVLELKEVCKIKVAVARICLGYFNQGGLHYSWHLIKKHLDLKEVSSKGMEGLKKIRGATIAHFDGNHTLDLVVMPLTLSGQQVQTWPANFMAEMSLILLNKVLTKFLDLLHVLSPEEMARDTLKKTPLINKGWMKVLHQDQEFILSVLDKALAAVKHDDLCIRPFFHRFGQKSREMFDLEEICTSTSVHRISLHVALNLSPLDTNMTFFWSRAGLQDLVGSRSKLYTCMSIHECANMQSALDNRPLDIAPALQNLSTHDKVTFWQVYVDSPHTHYMSTFRHPASGLIVNCGLSHPNYQGAIAARAQEYILHMKDMARKARCPYNLRIEFVAAFEDNFPKNFDPERFYDQRRLHTLLRDYPMLVPFKWQPEELGINGILSQCLTSMVDQLRKLVVRNLDKGGFLETWKAFELELALEEAFYGHPLSIMDLKLSCALGTNATHEFSLTHMRGFMGLGPPNAAALEETPPPLGHWTRDETQRGRIIRLFPFTCYLEAQPALLGAQLVIVLLKDLFKRNFELPLAEMKESCPGTLKGHIGLDTLTNNLGTRPCFPRPFCFARARTLVEKQGLDPVAILKAGFGELGLKFFPDIKYRDLSGHKKATWNYWDFLEVHGDDQEPSTESKAMALVGDIAMEMERLGLCYARTVERYREHGMPWLAHVMRRLPARLGTATRFKVLLFTSCVGMLMNNDFISYTKLKSLIADMQVTQGELQGLKILSSSLFPKTFGFNLWKLHMDIPHRMVPQTTSLKRKFEPPKERASVEEMDAPVLDQEDQPDVPASKALYMPAGTSRRWDPQELSFINVNSAVKTGEAYKMYVARCRDAQIGARLYKYFQKKRRELLEG